MKNKVHGLMGISSKAGKVVSGTDVVLDEISKNHIHLVIVAEDASEKTKKNIKFVCDKNHVETIIFGNIDENSKSIGKKNRAIIGLKDKNLSEAIKKEILGGEVFGEN